MDELNFLCWEDLRLIVPQLEQNALHSRYHSCRWTATIISELETTRSRRILAKEPKGWGWTNEYHVPDSDRR